MAIIRGIGVFGDTTDDPLTSTATTINSPGLADLPAVASPDIAVLTLDPDREAGDPETVIVTAHTADATSATVTRGEDGTTARQHETGTHWENAGRLEYDRGGGVLDGDATGTDSLVVGPADSTHNHVVVVGSGANTNDNEGVAVGQKARAGLRGTAVGGERVGVAGDSFTNAKDYATAIGANAVASSSGTFSVDQGGVAVGVIAKADGFVRVAVGAQADASADRTTAIGGISTASGTESITIGQNSTASATGAVAVGRSASATHQDAVALGRAAASSTADQVAIGPRHLEIGDVTTPAGGAAGFTRLASRDNGGTQELVVVFANGTVKVLADDV